jgi:hypothetical protein
MDDFMTNVYIGWYRLKANKQFQEALPALVVLAIVVIFIIFVILLGSSMDISKGNFVNGKDGFNPWIMEEPKVQGYPIWRARYGNYLTKGMANDMTNSWDFR